MTLSEELLCIKCPEEANPLKKKSILIASGNWGKGKEWVVIADEYRLS